jgi:hypothetical protein
MSGFVHDFFGTRLRPHVRWQCLACGFRTVTRLLPPIAERERLFCKRCRRGTVFEMALYRLPVEWGGAVPWKDAVESMGEAAKR